MKNLFHADPYNEVVERMNKLDPSSEKQWGKMNVAQMMAHCKEAFKVPLSEKKMPRMFLGLLVGWMVKKKLYNDVPYAKGLPTAPNFIIKNERDFNSEKQQLMELVNKFYSLGPTKVGLYPHPMFGSFTSDQWGMSMYKHLDHHLRQFSV